MLLVDGSQSPNVPVWSQTVTAAPLTAYQFSFFASSWGKNGDEPGAFDPASLQLLVNGVAVGTVVSTPSDIGVWQSQTFLLSPFPTPITTLTLVDVNQDYVGNDFALDDIKLVAAVPEASTTVSFGLLLALGMGGAVIAARKRKATTTT